MDTSNVPLIPAGGRILEGIRKRERIRELLAEGKSKNQICGILDIGTTAINKHLRIINKEDAVSQEPSGVGVA
jgi:DNA-binding CsgD family transcriptional regulator